MDTNCDPSNVDFVIPSNDDAIRAIKLLVGKIADAALEGKAMRKDVEEEVPEFAGERQAEEELELTDEELLGSATLAKISSRGKEDLDEIFEEGDLYEDNIEDEFSLEWEEDNAKGKTGGNKIDDLDDEEEN